MKGQAFDTFKLMIAAVIAVAILGILLGILRGMSPTVTDPLSATQQLLRDTYTSKIQKAYPNPVVFTSGTVVDTESLRGGAGVAASQIAVDCDDIVDTDLVCSADDYSITANTDVTVTIKVDCRNSAKTAELGTNGFEASGGTEARRCIIHYEYP
jgi:hypothetical protein